MDIINFEEIDSTNSYAKANLKNLNDMTVLSTDLQTAGHGQFNRYWHSSNKNGGNCYITIILKPKNKEHVGKITSFASLIIGKTLEKYGLEPKFKYPNDVMISGKKIAGILAEATSHGEELIGIALGMGINLNLEKEELETIDQPATSIFNETGRVVDKIEFIKYLLDNFKREYTNLIEYGIGGKIYE
ncbi:biotin--[bacterium]|nr:biotin--[acetyl-CoA-carboxylase] ligase [bacterium]